MNLVKAGYFLSFFRKISNILTLVRSDLEAKRSQTPSRSYWGIWGSPSAAGKMKFKKSRKLWSDSGSVYSEYALIAAVLSLLLAAPLSQTKTEIEGVFQTAFLTHETALLVSTGTNSTQTSDPKGSGGEGAREPSRSNSSSNASNSSDGGTWSTSYRPNLNPNRDTPSGASNNPNNSEPSDPGTQPRRTFY